MKPKGYTFTCGRSGIGRTYEEAYNNGWNDGYTKGRTEALNDILSTIERLQLELEYAFSEVKEEVGDK